MKIIREYKSSIINKEGIIVLSSVLFFLKHLKHKNRFSPNLFPKIPSFYSTLLGIRIGSFKNLRIISTGEGGKAC